MTFRANVAVPADGEVAVNADLSKIGAGARWYTSWWFLSAAAVVVAGATGTAAWFLLRDDNPRVPVTGTLRRDLNLTRDPIMYSTLDHLGNDQLWRAIQASTTPA